MPLGVSSGKQRKGVLGLQIRRESEMGIFHEMQDVYYGTLELAQEIKKIPSECDCGDAEGHLNGRCSCCAENKTSRAFSESSNNGCLTRLNRLRKAVSSLDAYLQEGSGRIEPSQDSSELQGQLSLILSLVYQLARECERIQTDLDEFRKHCAADALLRIKEGGASLDHYAAKLNALL